MTIYQPILLALAFLIAAPVAQSQQTRYVRPDVAELCRAAATGRIAEIERLLDAGTPVDGIDSDGQQPLLKAIKGGHHRATLLLLQSGADPNTRSRNETGSNALSFAAQGGDLRLVEALIEAGAKPNRRGRIGTHIQREGSSGLPSGLGRPSRRRATMPLATSAPAAATLPWPAIRPSSTM